MYTYILQTRIISRAAACRHWQVHWGIRQLDTDQTAPNCLESGASFSASSSVYRCMHADWKSPAAVLRISRLLQCTTDNMVA